MSLSYRCLLQMNNYNAMYNGRYPNFNLAISM
jgi:hypothetical protein